MAGQAFEGVGLDLNLLDARVFEWKTELGLIGQPEFPPRTVTMSEGSIRYHDRSHILVQDYLGKSSFDLQGFFSEVSCPPVFEELLTYFFSKVVQRPHSNLRNFTLSSTVREDIHLMKHLGYIDDESVFLNDIQNVSLQIEDYYQQMLARGDFFDFICTLSTSTLNCADWSALLVHG